MDAYSEKMVKFALGDELPGGVEAIASRKAIVELAKQNSWTMYGMHFPAAEGIK